MSYRFGDLTMTMRDERGNRIPTPEDIEVEFITNGLLSGRYDSFPAYDDRPPPDMRDMVMNLWDEIYLQCGYIVSQHIRTASRARQRDYNTEMISTLEGLKKFSQPYGIPYNRMSPTIRSHIYYPLRSRIPPMDTTIYNLLQTPPFQPFGDQDAKVLALAKWFKTGFMKWIDPIKCPSCNGSTHSVGNVKPDPREERDGAGRVELHLCEVGGCGGKRRFARYNDVDTLLNTREGRCGEWANLFYAFLRAAGVEARYVWNSEDHVWNEYWSPTLQHWVHVDSCEAATNKPLLYDRGWGKKQAFCLAFGAGGAEDVTRAYVSDWRGECQLRRQARGWNEKHLRRKLAEHTARMRVRMTKEDREKYLAMDIAQSKWIGDERRRMEEAEKDELGGRTSGPADWRAKRQELGLGTILKPSYRVIASLSPLPAELKLYGQAAITEDGIQLTTSAGQTSAIFAPTPLKCTSDFKVEFTFRIAAPPGCGEADGLAICFAGSKGMGLGGYGLGYTGLGEIGDFAVEIDTYRTQDFADDPPTPHISVHSPPNAHHDHSISCTPPGSLPHLSDGRDYTLEIYYEGSSRRVRGYLNWTDGEGGEKMEIGVCDVMVPHGQGSQEWYVGLTGSCGGLWQKQEILEWSIEEIVFETATEGSPTELSTFPMEQPGARSLFGSRAPGF